MREPPESASVSNGTPLPPGEKRSGTKLEKTSLSAGGFLRVPYGFGIGLWLHTRQAIIKISNNMAHHGYSIRIIFCSFPNLVEKIVIIV